MKNLILAISLFLGATGLAQVTLSSNDLNTTEPVSLSWIVGEFEVIRVDSGEAILAPVQKGKLLPDNITVKYSPECIKQYPYFEATQRFTFVIREGWVSQIFAK